VGHWGLGMGGFIWGFLLYSLIWEFCWDISFFLECLIYQMGNFNGFDEKIKKSLYISFVDYLQILI
jgi:hypothetical protein